MKREAIGHPDLAAAMSQPMGDLPDARFIGASDDGPKYRVVTCFICGGDSNRVCACHDGSGAACDMICNLVS